MLRALVREPWIRRWGDDPRSWNIDAADEDGEVLGSGDGMPGRSLVGGALSLWLRANPGGSPADAAVTFNLPIGFAVDALRPDLFGPADLDEAVQTWSLLLAGDVPIGLAACVFGVRPVDVLDAMSSHFYMFVDTVGGVAMIGHEGE